MNQGEGSPAWYVEICLEKVADNLEIKFLGESGFQNLSLSNVRCSKVTHSRWAMPLKSSFLSSHHQLTVFCLSIAVSFNLVIFRSILSSNNHWVIRLLHMLKCPELFHIFLSLDHRLINALSMLYQCLIIAWSSDCCCHCRAQSHCGSSPPNGLWKEILSALSWDQHSNDEIGDNDDDEDKDERKWRWQQSRSLTDH